MMMTRFKTLIRLEEEFSGAWNQWIVVTMQEKSMWQLNTAWWWSWWSLWWWSWSWWWWRWWSWWSWCSAPSVQHQQSSCSCSPQSSVLQCTYFLKELTSFLFFETLNLCTCFHVFYKYWIFILLSFSLKPPEHSKHVFPKVLIWIFFSFLWNTYETPQCMWFLKIEFEFHSYFLWNTPASAPSVSFETHAFTSWLRQI